MGKWLDRLLPGGQFRSGWLTVKPLTIGLLPGGQFRRWYGGCLRFIHGLLPGGQFRRLISALT